MSETYPRLNDVTRLVMGVDSCCFVVAVVFTLKAVPVSTQYSGHVLSLAHTVSWRVRYWRCIIDRESKTLHTQVSFCFFSVMNQ